MKILRIQFKNLNSLPSGDIDLESGPLAHAGLFAITGPTGAGKSTILDAITLALYGRAARYDSVANPEDMMSRHSASCQAELLFEVRGIRYRAEWQLRRARNKSDGKLQPPTRRLYRSLPTGDEPLTQHTRETDRLVEELIGLNYDRFLRSVLLAQGEFARFLKATENERAELLESLTATTIYSELSTLAFREASDRETALQQRRHVLGNRPLLDEEGRALRSMEAATHAATLTTLATQQDEITARLHRGQQRQHLKQAQAAIATQSATFAQEQKAAAPQLQALQTHREASPLFPELQHLDTLHSRLQEEEKLKTEAEHQRHDAARSLQAAHNAARQLYSEAHAVSLAALKELAAKENATKERLAKGTEWLATYAHHAALEEQLPLLVDSLSQLKSLRDSHRQGASTLSQLQEQHGRLIEERNTARKRHEEASKSLTTAQLLLKERHNALKNSQRGQDKAALLAYNEKAEGDLLLLHELRAAIEKRDKATREATELTNKQTTLLEDIERAQEQCQATQVEAQKQAELLENAHKTVSLLERIASLEAQRAQLIRGTECPLCGSRRHPFVEKERLPESNELLEAKRHIDVARGANETAAKEAQLAIRELERFRTELALTQKRAAELRASQMAEYEQFESLARRLRVYTPEQLAEVQASILRRRSENNERIAAIEAAEKAIDQQTLATARLEGESNRLAEALTASETTLASLSERITEGKKKQSETADTLKERLSALEAALLPFELPLPAEGEETTTRLSLETTFKRYQTGLRTEAQLKGDLLSCQHMLERATEQHRHLEHEGTSLPPATQALTGEEALHLNAWRAATEAPPFQVALRALPELASRLTTAEATLQERQKNTALLRQQLNEHKSHLATLLANTPLQTIANLRLSRLPPPQFQESEELEARLTRTCEQLQAQAAQLCQQLHELRDAPEDDALEGLAATLQKLRDDHLHHAGLRARLLKELEDDDALRREVAEEARALEEEEAKLAVWLQLRQLIGSADGKKFSRFAQGLSLELLVRHANVHLTRLNDRYTLQRSPKGDLELLIVDRHQANAIRPMQSLSGGESFLASLALALGLSDLAGRNTRIDSLFIDEGFGSLDPDTLDTAVSALDALRFNDKTIGVISHVELLKERIPVQIRVVKKSGGQSVIELPA